MNLAIPFRCYVIGGESLLVQCTERLLEQGHRVLGVITESEDIARWAHDRELRVIEPGPDLASRIGDEPFEWLFSIAHLSIIPDDVLRLPERGAINFHDGPLPRYAGLNATSWAILQGERTHGVTWHRIEGGVDEGDVVAQRLFELAEQETALTLNTRCYELGIETFAQLVDELGRGEENRRPQDLSQRTYFGRHDRPPAACVVDWTQPAHRIDAMVRALDYGRYANPVGVPKIVPAGGALLVSEVKRGADSVGEPPGTVLGWDDEGLEVATSTGSLIFGGVTSADGSAVSPEEGRQRGIEPGTQLALRPEDRARLSGIDSDLARREPFFVRRLAAAHPARLAEVSHAATEPVRLERRALRTGANPATLAAALGAWLGRVGGVERCDVAYRHPAIAPRVRGAEPLYATHVPLRLEVPRSAPFGDVVDACRRELARLDDAGTYLTDLIRRQPALRVPDWDVALEIADELERAAPPPGTAAAVVTDGTRAALVFDATRLSEDAAARIQHQLEVVFEAGASAPDLRVGELPTPLGGRAPSGVGGVERHRRRLRRATPACTSLFEAQVDRTPDAIAVARRSGLADLRRARRARANRSHTIWWPSASGRTCRSGSATDRSAGHGGRRARHPEGGRRLRAAGPAYPADRIAFMHRGQRARRSS